MIETRPAEYRRTIARAGLRVREGPSTAHRVVNTLPFGAWALVVDDLGPWLNIGHGGGLAFVFERWTVPWWWMAWSTDYEHVTQAFGAHPENYKQFGLPGHEGVDIRAPIDTPIYAVADGEVFLVTDRKADGSPSNYGWHVRIAHEHGYKTIYAHLTDDGTLPYVGSKVTSGERIGTSGATGNVWPRGKGGAHLHLSIKSKKGQAGWPWKMIDPHPFINLWKHDYRSLEEE